MYEIIKVNREVYSPMLGDMFMCRVERPELRGTKQWRSTLMLNEKALAKAACSGSIVLIILRSSCETRRKHIASRIHGIRAEQFKTDGRS